MKTQKEKTNLKHQYKCGIKSAINPTGKYDKNESLIKLKLKKVNKYIEKRE